MSYSNESIIDLVKSWATQRTFYVRGGGFIAGKTEWAIDFNVSDESKILIQRLGENSRYEEFWEVLPLQAFVWAIFVELGQDPKKMLQELKGSEVPKTYLLERAYEILKWGYRDSDDFFVFTEHWAEQKGLMYHGDCSPPTIFLEVWFSTHPKRFRLGLGHRAVVLTPEQAFVWALLMELK